MADTIQSESPEKTRERNEAEAPERDNPPAGPKTPEATSDREQQNEASSETPKPGRRNIAIGIGVVLLVLAVIFGSRYLAWSRNHVSTDDAYVTGDLVSVSPLIGGTLSKLTVQEGDYVQQGQLIGILDQAGPKAQLDQAKANYQAAVSQMPQAERTLLYQQESTEAAIKKAQSALASQRAKSSGAQQQVTLTSETVRNQVAQARAQVSASLAQQQQSQAQVGSAMAARDNALSAVNTSRAALANYEQQVQTAQRAAQSASSRAASAQAVAERAVRDATRFRTLYEQDAISAQAYDSARSQALSAQAQADAAKADAEQAASQVESARRAVEQARSQLDQTRKSVAQAQAQVVAAQKAADASGEQVQVARAGLGLASANQTQVGIQESNLLSTNEQTSGSEADVANAEAGKQQVEVRRKQIDTYRAQLQQAKAALANAQVTWNDTYLYAPDSGEVVRKDANAGQTLAAGTPVATIAKGNYVWVVANFKETQLADVRTGQPVDVEVDAFPGKVFKGIVKSINAATGASTALLPPDNATGNFTKVVQRVGVRIEFVAAAPGDDNKYATAEDLKNLRQGMSVIATIDVSNHDQTNSRGGKSSGENGVPAQGAPSSAPSAPGNTNSQPMGTPPANMPDSSSQAPPTSPASTPASGDGQNPSEGAPTQNNIPNPGSGLLGSQQPSSSSPSGVNGASQAPGGPGSRGGPGGGSAAGAGSATGAAGAGR